MKSPEIQFKRERIVNAVLDLENLSHEDEERLLDIIEAGQYLKPLKNDAKNAFEMQVTGIDDRPKYSTGYISCTGIIAVGKNKVFGNNISFMTHDLLPATYVDLLQNKSEYGEALREGIPENETPETLLAKHTADLKETLNLFKMVTEKDSVDIVVIGGIARADFQVEAYKFAIKYYTDILKEFKPEIILGPQSGGSTNVFFDTKNRRLYTAREATTSERNESYLPKNLTEQSKKW